MKRIAIIGGGAAGLMAAATLSEESRHEVHLFERNTILGHKVRISGGGRCNVTTGLTDMKEILSKYPRGARFLRHAFHSFTPQDLMKWIESLGVSLKCEADMRVFPKSDQGEDIVKLYQRAMKGVHVHKKTPVIAVRPGFEVETEKGVEQFDAVILTTGGQAYKHTGSKGDGYTFAREFGHSISDLAPSLNAYILKERWMKAGLSFELVRLRMGKHEFTGPIVFTHKGISGPAVFAISSLSAMEPGKELRVDFLPAVSVDNLRIEWEKVRKEQPKQSLANSLRNFVPKSIAVGLCENPEKASELASKKEINRILEALKNSTFIVTGQAPGDEFVTAGGVKLNEIDPKSMESKLHPGLYFAGEILNADGFTGGFNLHCAWATGRLAGLSCI